MLGQADHDHPLITLNVGVPDCDLPRAVSMDAPNHYFSIVGRTQFGKGLTGNRRVWGGNDFDHFGIKAMQVRYGKQLAPANEF